MEKKTLSVDVVCQGAADVPGGRIESLGPMIVGS